MYRTLELLVGFHQKYGYQDFVINYVFESSDSLQDLLILLHPLDTSIHVFWLTCAEKEQEWRIQVRNRTSLDWELKRFVELQRIQRSAAQNGFIGKEVDTTKLSATEVAEQIWHEILKS